MIRYDYIMSPSEARRRRRALVVSNVSVVADIHKHTLRVLVIDTHTYMRTAKRAASAQQQQHELLQQHRDTERYRVSCAQHAFTDDGDGDGNKVSQTLAHMCVRARVCVFTFGPLGASIVVACDSSRTGIFLRPTFVDTVRARPRVRVCERACGGHTHTHIARRTENRANVSTVCVCVRACVRPCMCLIATTHEIMRSQHTCIPIIINGSI